MPWCWVFSSADLYQYFNIYIDSDQIRFYFLLNSTVLSAFNGTSIRCVWVHWKGKVWEWVREWKSQICWFRGLTSPQDVCTGSVGLHQAVIPGYLADLRLNEFHLMLWSSNWNTPSTVIIKLFIYFRMTDRKAYLSSWSTNWNALR